jgi:hypothetical protein
MQASSKHTFVRLTAGDHVVETDPNKEGIFQQPLNLTVEQGVTCIVFDVLTPSKTLLATLPLEIADVIRKEKRGSLSEVSYNMRQKSKSIHNPKLKLTMIMSGDEEQRLVSSGQRRHRSTMLFQDVVVQETIRQHMDKVKDEGADSTFAEIEALKQGCTGPLQIFEGLGGHSNVHVTVLGPPDSRKWMFAIYKNKEEMDNGRQALIEVDLMRVQSVQHDPARKQIFVISHMIDRRTSKEIRFKIVDRSRDVWVSFLKKTMERAREYRQTEYKARKTTRSFETIRS